MRCNHQPEQIDWLLGRTQHTHNFSSQPVSNIICIIVTNRETNEQKHDLCWGSNLYKQNTIPQNGSLQSFHMRHYDSNNIYQDVICIYLFLC